MKVCKYCSEVNADSATRCISCKSAEFINKCNNCDMDFEGGFCPSCGVKAGRRAKVCQDCGAEFYTNACPECGWKPESQSKPAPQIGYAPPQPVQAGDTWGPKPKKPPRMNILIVIAVIFAPFITTWFILFKEYSKAAKIFAAGWSVLTGIAMVAQSTPLVFLCIIPCFAYFAKMQYGRYQQEDATRKKGRNVRKRIMIQGGAVAGAFLIFLIISAAIPKPIPTPTSDTSGNVQASSVRTPRPTEAQTMPSSTEIQSIEPPALTGEIVNVNEYANIRSNPDPESERLLMADKGAIVEIIEETGEWYKVRVDGNVGYVLSKYVEPQQKDLIPTVTPTPKPYNPPSITLAEFESIKTGMNYEEVVEIIGGEGELLSEVDMNMGSEYVSKMYIWEGSGSLGANANITFQGGKVTMKAQFGLK